MPPLYMYMWHPLDLRRRSWCRARFGLTLMSSLLLLPLTLSLDLSADSQSQSHSRTRSLARLLLHTRAHTHTRARKHAQQISIGSTSTSQPSAFPSDAARFAAAATTRSMSLTPAGGGGGGGWGEQSSGWPAGDVKHSASHSHKDSSAPAVCPVMLLQVFPIDRDDDSTDKSGWDSPVQVIDHLLTFTGAVMDASQPPDPESRSVAALVARPAQLVWADTHKSHFECWDARGDHAILGTPGGDVAEFILMLNAVEHTRPLDKAYTYDVILTVFKDYLAEIDGTFYMHTDASGFLLWASETKKRCGLTNPLKPRSDKQRDVALHIAPAFLRCSHLQLMMSKEDAYKVRRGLVEDVIRAVLRVLMDDTDVLRAKIEFEILQGYVI